MGCWVAAKTNMTELLSRPSARSVFTKEGQKAWRDYLRVRYNLGHQITNIPLALGESLHTHPVAPTESKRTTLRRGREVVLPSDEKMS